MLAARSAIATRPAVGARRVHRASARSSAVTVAREAPWAPGTDAPAHLNGSLAGDFGFDVLNLGVDAEKLKWYQQAELQHCRWAMLGAAGVMLPSLAAHIGVSWPGAGVSWVDAATFSYYAPAGSLFVAQMFMFAWVENKRWADINNPGSQAQDPIFKENKLPAGEVGYPGGIFDPFGYSKGAELNSMKLKEIKNGRLAMLACLGFAVQSQTTGTSDPIDNLAAHMASPWSTTVLSNQPDLFVWRWADPNFLAGVAPIKGLPLI